jgi:glycosyltransferase involved in cell wall biosynthesis
LWVKAGKLLPVDTGGKIRSFNLLRQLATGNDVTLLSYYSGAPDPAYEDELRRIFPQTVAISTRALDGSAAAQAVDYAYRAFSSAPYAVSKFTALAVQQRIADWDRLCEFDVAVCDFLSASMNFPAQPRTPTVLFQHNVESILWRRQADTERHPLKRFVFAREARKMERYERDTVARFSHVIAVSETDRMAMASMTSPDRISVVPTGVDTLGFRPAVRNESPPPEVLFLGSMDWEPNIDAVQFFCATSWPAIARAVPGARFRVVGRNPPSSIQRLASASVEIVGRVPSVGEHLHRAAVFVVPLRIGGGTRLKIYEAMGAAKAVVSTAIGAEGLDVHHGHDIVLADDPASFADAVVRLLRDSAERRRLEDGALALAARYDWSAVAEQFERMLVRAIETSERSAAAVDAAQAVA